MQEETTLEFRGVIEIIKKRMKLIMCITIISTAISAILSLFIIEPTYEAKISIVIGKEINHQDQKYHYDDVIMYQKLIKTYAAIAESDDVIKSALDRLDIKITIKQFQRAMKVIPQPDTQILDIKVQSKNPVNAKDMVDALTSSFMEAGKKIYPTGNIEIMNKAEVPNVPVKPNKTFNIAIGFFLGLMVSVVRVFMLEYMDNTIKTESSVEKYLGISVTGIIPEHTVKLQEQNEKMIIMKKYPKSPVAEAYRTLRTNLQYSSIDRKIKSILITSPDSSEGKSTTVSNLAFTMLQDDKKVLVVDCDIRKPNIHKMFGIPNEIGLVNFLVDEVSLSKALVKYSDNLYILTSGTIPPNPSEMLSSKKMKNLLEFFKDKFDYIIIDSPPINVFTDAQILSTIVDGVLLVVSSGESIKEECIRAKELLLKVQANILGVILTKVPYKLRNGHTYYYYYGKKKIRNKRKEKIKGKRSEKRRERKK